MFFLLEEQYVLPTAWIYLEELMHIYIENLFRGTTACFI